MEFLNHLLTIQILAALGAVVGELVTSELLVTVAFLTFFTALVGMFVQMTATFLVGLNRSDGRALAY